MGLEPSYFPVFWGNFSANQTTPSLFTDSFLNASWGEIKNNTGTNADVTNISGIVLISLLFCIIGVVGILGNSSVIMMILLDRQMRRSVTNLYIMNLAAADLLVMLFGIPEIVQFMLNEGWLMGEVMCKVERFVLVFCLYTSVITQVAVCIERYLAIVHPLMAHVFCSRTKTLVIIAVTWPTSVVLGLPVAIFNHVISPDTGQHMHFCSLVIPGSTRVRSVQYLVTVKYLEFALFYLIPMIVQVVCYTITGRTLYASATGNDLHRKQITYRDGKQKEKMSDTQKQRKGVVKMLIASVIIYFISYSPHQVLLFYNTFSHKRFHENWIFLVFVTAMGYINSAANPFLYCIFSQVFRNKFKKILNTVCCRKSQNPASSEMLKMYSADTAMETVVTKATNGRCVYTKLPQQKSIIENKSFRTINSEL